MVPSIQKPWDSRATSYLVLTPLKDEFAAADAGFLAGSRWLLRPGKTSKA
jgi:hypothetical protein